MFPVFIIIIIIVFIYYCVTYLSLLYYIVFL